MTESKTPITEFDDPENTIQGVLIYGCSFDSVGIHFRAVNRQTS